MTAPLSTQAQYPLEDAKQSIVTLCMYYYQGLREAGFSENDAKARVANLLEESYKHYCAVGQMEAKPLGGVSMEARLQKVTDLVKSNAKTSPELRQAYQELLSIQSQLRKGDRT